MVHRLLRPQQVRGGDSCGLRNRFWDNPTSIPDILQSYSTPSVCSARLSLRTQNVLKRGVWSDTCRCPYCWMNEQIMSLTRLAKCPCFWLILLLMIFMFSEWISIASIKTFWYIAVTSILIYLNIPQESLWILGSLMVIDTITGIAKQYKVDSIGITPRRMSTGIITKFVTFLCLLSGGLVINHFDLDPKYYIQTVMSILIMAEFYSIIQNVYAVRTGIMLPEYDAISIALKRLTWFIQDLIEKLTTIPKKK